MLRPLPILLHRVRQSGRAGGLPTLPRLNHELPAGGADTVAIARFVLRAGSHQGRSSCRAHPFPDTSQCTVHKVPLLLLECELRSALFGDAVVLPLPSAFGLAPFRCDKTESFKTV